MNHMRTNHSIKISTNEINVDMNVEEFSDAITDEDLRMALDEAEFDSLVAEEFGDKVVKIPKEGVNNENFEGKLKSFVERILILAKDKALLKQKVKRMAMSQKKQACFL